MILIPAEKKIKKLIVFYKNNKKQQNLRPKATQKCAALGPTH